MKKIPMRTCVVTREKFPKNELIRVVRTPDNQVIIDESGKANGREKKKKKDREVILKAQKNKILNKHLEINIPETVYEELLK